MLQEAAMMSSRFSAGKGFGIRAWAVAGSFTLLACGGQSAFAQTPPLNANLIEHEQVGPPLLYKETWKQPPHTGPLTDENRRITPEALTNADLEIRLYGTDASNIQVTQHNGIPDVW